MGELPFEKVKREILVKKKYDSSLKFGKYPDERTVSELITYGIVNIDKPSGPTSHQVSAYVQKILNINKSGHSGTLDPKVTGVLPVALGKATRVVQVLLNAGKEYICLMHVHADISEGKLRSVFNDFTGKINQLPPVKSAVKRQLRVRKIYYLEILEMDGREVLFKVGCQAGTYIRKLVHDVGIALGSGAHMVELRRTKAAGFSEDSLVTLQDLTDAYYYYKEEKKEFLLKNIIKPIESGVNHLAKIWVMDTTVDSVCHGASLKIPGIVKLEDGIELEDDVAVMTLKDELILVGKAKMISRDILKENKGIAVKPEQVFMNIGVYPRIEK